VNAQRMVVLMYHRIGDAHNEWERQYCVSPATFAAHMQRLAREGMRAVSIDDFVAWLKGRRELPEQSFLLTFDDGFLGIHDHAAPVLRELGWPATVFLVTGLLGGRDEWCRLDNPSGETYPLLGPREIEALAADGFSFHSHTRSHPRLPTLNDAELIDQLAGSKADIERLLGGRCDFLAYPFGLADDRVVQTARAAGYAAAFSVRPGFNRRGEDAYRIRRLDVFGTDSAAMLARKVRMGSNGGSLRTLAGYYLGRVLARAGGRPGPG
jgi:peptidoglycan/xylan/chitin deacetylase (PgdA/CDA1 family)